MRLGRKAIGIPDARLKPFALWDKMYRVWQALNGPVINPTIVRQEMLKSGDEGAVWDALARALIDRVIEFDPAVWTIGR